MRAIGDGFVRRVNEGVSIGNGARANIDIWHYAGDDDYADVTGSGFFNALASDLAVGSIIMCSTDLSGTPKGYMLMVTANTGSAVTVAAFLATAIA